MFDMRTRTSRFVGVGSVAQETFFNDAFRRQEGQPTDGLAHDIVEKQLQTYEDDFLRMRDVAHGVMADERQGTLAERQAMSFCIAVQLLRTAKTRTRLLAETELERPAQHGLLRWLRPNLRERAMGDPDFARKEQLGSIPEPFVLQSHVCPSSQPTAPHSRAP